MEDLLRLTRSLRLYLEEQRALGAPGLPAAADQARQDWRARVEVLRKRKLEALTSELRGQSSSSQQSAPAQESGPATSPANPPPRGRRAPPRPAASPGEPARGERAGGRGESGGKKKAPLKRPGASLQDSLKEDEPAAAPSLGSGEPIWKQLGSRPVHLFKKTTSDDAPSPQGGDDVSETSDEKTSSPARDPQEPPKPAAEPEGSSSEPEFEEVRRTSSTSQPPERPPRANQAQTPSLFGEEWDAEHDPTRTARPLPGFDATPEQSQKLEEMDQGQKLEFLRECLGECTRCKLSQNRNTIVFGDGSPDADLVFVGEGPGYHEDRQGVPFVGKAGKLLDKMIRAMGLEREGVYIANTVKCRPPNNRDPEPDELARCTPFLYKQLETIEPRAIITLGRFASQCLLDTDDSMGRMRGRWRDWRGVPVMPTYHPAYLLRSPKAKRKTWEDLQKVMKMLGLEPPS